MKKYFLPFMIVTSAYAGKPVFKVTPNVTGQPQLIAGQLGTYIYQITNNAPYTLNNIGVIHLPPGVSLVSKAGEQYCTFPLNLKSQTNCLIKLKVDSTKVKARINGGPQVCFSATKPVYCSQPAKGEQLATEILAGPVPSSCDANYANFNHELSNNFDTTPVDPGWGPARKHLSLSPSNPNLTRCPTTDRNNSNSITWMRKRALAAYDFWIKQKLNYCHHHNPDFATPLVVNGKPRASIPTQEGGYCSTALDMMPGSPYYKKPVRWNYTGVGSETAENWLHNNQMWYGIDCSDFTSFIYNFAFGIQFNSDTGYQAGQATDGSQNDLTPNSQSIQPHKVLQKYDNSNPKSPAGVLICKNGQTEEENPGCGGVDGYFSVFKKGETKPTPSQITPAMLNLLKPGDLLFLGFKGHDGNNKKSIVTHVITWTGKKVGYGPNDIKPDQIAPEEICPTSWQPKIGDWVIMDSHYQGPDYRVFSACFYQNNIWGARRVIGYMKSLS
jgi:cell wall-associated NlpC family hydrolase